MFISYSFLSRTQKNHSQATVAGSSNLLRIKSEKSEIPAATTPDIISDQSIPTTATIDPLPTVHYSPIQTRDDVMAEFFCASPHRSRIHDAVGSLPPYLPHGDGEKLPEYSELSDEPVNLARYMFIYGFLCPLFWLFGIGILCSPLRATSDWALEKTEEERESLLLILRTAERKWAQRCLWATLTLACCFGLAAGAFISA